MLFKKVAIIQSNYIPWKGYFDIINQVDEFILLDDVQFTRRDWRNRNLIKTPNGLQWLTIPVNVKDNYFAKINEVTIADKQWKRKHLAIIKQNYSNAPYFKMYKDWLEVTYLQIQDDYLSLVNYQLINSITTLLGIPTKISFSSDYGVYEGKNERLIQLCKKVHGTEYFTGPSAKTYLNEDLFSSFGIKVNWVDYTDYKPYQQLYPPFEHGVSILDLIFSEGPSAKKFMKSFDDL